MMAGRGKRRQKKWRTIYGLIKYFSGEFEFSLKHNTPNIIRFNPIQIAEWLDELCRRKRAFLGTRSRGRLKTWVSSSAGLFSSLTC